MNPSLQRTRLSAARNMARLQSILQDMPITAQSRYALAEIILIRAAAILENSIAEIAYKLACGARFANGNREQLTVICSSLSNARITMLSENGARAQPKGSLRWTKAAHVIESTKCVIDDGGAFATSCRVHGQIIAEIFDVRHYAAHRNKSSRAKYQKWVRSQYGQERPIQLGYFLLTRNLRPTANLDRYLRTIPVVIADLCAG